MNNACLIAIDGSKPCLRALEYAIQDAATRKEAPHIYLVNVQPGLSPNVTRFIDGKTVENFHRDNGEESLAAAKARLGATGLSSSSHVMVGEAAPSLVQFAQSKGCSLIVIGTHGFGTMIGLVMGSVTTKVVHLSNVPVLLVK
ncbi:universal stress protein [Rhodoferax antarcticus]|uniref:Universal stress family protein n=1 Tax=Rhodoferax antarcticus ANT.BR TaxID=1111071 RepID=A0A1Q8YHI1_9BURK|nr:universal stress protein [Rhodoferax antarcticus]APW45199.1 hypothetical protein RA876_01070 [Rhodoferax antarcticus]OLP07455.1 universal stress family protein [Rhodoferax antarcticus ANT.BR]